MVETALVLTLLVGMIFFIMNMGWILLMQQAVTERARQTLRSAVVHNWTATETANYLVYYSTTAPQNGGPGFLGLQTSQVTAQTLGTVGQPDYRLQVVVSGVPVVRWLPYNAAGTINLAPIKVTSPAQSLGAN